MRGSGVNIVCGVQLSVHTVVTSQPKPGRGSVKPGRGSVADFWNNTALCCYS